MSEVIVPVVAILSMFVVFPVIIFGSAIGRRFLKLKERELEIRQAELEVERERVTVMRLLGDERDGR